MQANKRKASYQLVPSHPPKKTKQCEGSKILPQPSIQNWIKPLLPVFPKDVWFEIIQQFPLEYINDFDTEYYYFAMDLALFSGRFRHHFSLLETIVALKRTCKQFREWIKQIDAIHGTSEAVDTTMKMYRKHYEFIKPYFTKAITGHFLLVPLQYK